MVSNKTKKLIISKSKRPPSNEIEVIDEYGDKRCFPITGELPLTIYVDKKEVVIKPKEGFGGIGGDYILPTSLANVNYFYKKLKGKEIVGCGGIKNYNTCLMHIYAGASRLQVGTYLYENDAEIFGNLKSDLYSYIWKNNLGDIKELVGCVKSKN